MLIGKTSELTEWPGEFNQPLMAALALSMGMVPVLMGMAPGLSTWLEKKAPSMFLRRRSVGLLQRGSLELADHAVICGYGPVGRDLAAELANQGVPTMIIDLNADEIRKLQSEGQHALFADATHPEVWALCGLERARLVAFTFQATIAIEPAMLVVQETNPAVPILVRTAFRRAAERLEAAGADVVVRDEEETARAVVDHALRMIDINAPREALDV